VPAQTNILDRILETKRQEVAAAKARTTLDDLKKAIRDLPKPRNFYAAIAAKPPRGIHVIAEIKKRSPSAGLIREDFDPVRIARIYHENGASALSVLTDGPYFDGKLEYVRQVREAVPIPVLRKDFIVDEYQIYESRLAGADAILLIADALNARQLLDMLILASELYLTSILEVHEADTVMKIRSVVGFPHERYSIVGINNRDLKTQTTDLGTTGRIADILEDDTMFITESGIKTRADVERMMRIGARGILIGETLMRSPDIAGKMNELFPWPATQ
jgi:indole-3-glycerol phosphate synthase